MPGKIRRSLKKVGSFLKRGGLYGEARKNVRGLGHVDVEVREASAERLSKIAFGKAANERRAANAEHVRFAVKRGTARWNRLLSSRNFAVREHAAESLGTFDQALAITVMSPLMETPIFIAHFFFSLVLVYAFGKAFKLSEGTRNILLLVSYIILSSVTFYHFHVGLVGTIPFLISVIVYRGMMGIFIFGDKLFNIIPFLTLAIGMEWGFHWMLNIQNYTGFINWVSIMLTNQLGVLALTVFVSLLGLEVLNIAMKGGGNNQ